MRLLLINYEYPPVGGGAANATREIARALVALGHEVTVLTAQYKGRQSGKGEDGINLLHAPALRRRVDRCSVFEMGTFLVSATLIVSKIIRAEKIDSSIAFFSIPSGPIAWWGYKRTDTPYIVGLRGGDVPGNEPGINFFHSILRPLRRAVFRNARAIFANSVKLREMAERGDPFPVSVINNGIDRNFWHPAPSKAPTPPWKFLYVGRFQEQKNLQGLFSHLAHYIHERQTGAWEIHMVGDGPQKEILKAQALRLGINGFISWHGWLSREELRTLYQQSHVLIHPARYEGMPNAVLEAASCGLPIVMSEEAASPDLITIIPEAKIYCSQNNDSFITTLDQIVRAYDSPSTFRANNISDWTTTAKQVLALL